MIKVYWQLKLNTYINKIIVPMLKFKSREVWKLLTIAGENICHRPFNYSFIYSKSIYGFPSSCARCALHSNKLLTWQIKQIIQQRFLFFISSIFSTFCALHWQLPIGYWGQCQWENKKKKNRENDIVIVPVLWYIYWKKSRILFA